ncbi:hypothetical protein NQ318_018153 [Aromia moschata]|uniref:Uncharacterized protein n=1 Tax=Aromia moschata TaxID=1265417 RepID=A0AAV8ZET9_9CUCU|nr:hypothetical protein NQ318_018153 [Aromia moschata]
MEYNNNLSTGAEVPLWCSTLTIMCGTKMATDGLPFGRRELGADNDILAGADFLSVFIESSLRRAYSETTTTVATTLTDIEEDSAQTIASNYIRTPRGTSPFAQTSTEDQYELYDTTLDSARSEDKSGVIVAVRVSSSVGRTVNKKLEPIGQSTLSDSLMEPPTTELVDQNFVASQEHPIIVAKVSKSELSVEESEPITRDSDSGSIDISRGYPAKVEALPSPFNPTSSFLGEELSKDPKQPFHQTVIYHDNPSDPARARSVSYSTVIQHPNLQSEIERNPQQYERRERNYNGVQSSAINSFGSNDGKRKMNETLMDVKTCRWRARQKNWEHPEKNHEESTKALITTERNWGMQQRSFSPPIPKVYGRPEQNYEIDEAVSVVTNGRAHGLQPSVPPSAAGNSSKKEDDNQKVGYVVEGRNYRKYRVEERTADGFIVGEYGVVSHDDGSLRG